MRNWLILDFEIFFLLANCLDVCRVYCDDGGPIDDDNRLADGRSRGHVALVCITRPPVTNRSSSFNSFHRLASRLPLVRFRYGWRLIGAIENRFLFMFH